MATYSFRLSKHTTLAAGVVDVVTMEVDYTGVEVVNLSGSPIYFKVNSETDPTVRGDNTEVIPPYSSVITPMPGRVSVIKLISATAADYSVAARN